MKQLERRRACKARLEQERTELQERLNLRRKNLKVGPLDGADLEETVVRVEGCEIASREVSLISEQLDAVVAALQALEDGTYGRCHNCGHEIAEKRLDALPFATQCVECRQLGEASQQQGSRTNRGPYASSDR